MSICSYTLCDLWQELNRGRSQKSLIIDAGSRGAGAPLAQLLPSPWDLYPEPFLGQENASNPAKTLFLENTYFRDKKTLQFRRRPFFIWRTLFWSQETSNSSEDLHFAFPILALSVLPPCPKIVSAPLFVIRSYQGLRMAVVQDYLYVQNLSVPYLRTISLTYN